ncbi:RsiW-degrading membrane proteinase PrsW (M82 family) [Bacillus pakistanensis]|uniref:RsiW-degrading membrane proteinase PrsW (M82 family) n=1 Tax=Rossellomorea pakistanensis TaxID=992288 RepID=A0ABS2NJV3_9BACI|nr:RsiW-degrading membrane proteinase PrsW (M82 family) [Bacillus pakistanensis]
MDSFNYYFPVLITITLFLTITFLYMILTREKSISLFLVLIISLFGIVVSIISAISLGYIVDQYNLVISNKDFILMVANFLLSILIPIIYYCKFKKK